jgi:sugar phosphate permease
MIVAGVIVDRIGVKRVLLFGTLVAGLCVGLLSLAPSYSVLLLLLALSGFGCGCIYPSAVKALVTWFPLRERATAIGINQSAINVSGIVGAAVLPSVALAFGWQYGFLLVGALTLVISGVCHALYREPRPEPPQMPGDDGSDVCDEECEHLEVVSEAAEVGDAVPGHTHWHGVRSLLLMRDIWLLSVGGLCLGIVEFSGLAHLVLYLNESLGYTAVAAGGLLAFSEAVGALGKPLSGLISDRLFHGRRKPVLMALAVLSLAVSVALAALDASVGWMIYPALAVFGIAAIGWAGLYTTLAAEIGGVHRAGLAAGLCSAMVNVGIMVGPLLFGYLVDRTGAYRPSWVLMAVVAAVAMVGWSLVREPSSKDETRDSPGGSTPTTTAV